MSCFSLRILQDPSVTIMLSGATGGGRTACALNSRPFLFARAWGAPARQCSRSEFHYLVAQFLAGLKNVIRLAGTSTRAPVLGLRPIRPCRCRVRKVPKPRISILSPGSIAFTILSRMHSTMTAAFFAAALRPWPHRQSNLLLSELSS